MQLHPCPLPQTLAHTFCHAISVFTTTSVDDGFTIDNSDCSTTSTTVSPTSQTFTATDTGGFECDFACANVTGPTVTITY